MRILLNHDRFTIYEPQCCRPVMISTFPGIAKLASASKPTSSTISRPSHNHLTITQTTQTMCQTTRFIFTGCAHSSVAVKECSEFDDRLDKSQRTCESTCKQIRPVPAYGFCPSCAERFAAGPHPLYSETLIRNIWSFKARNEMYLAVDPTRVPREAAFRPYPEGGLWKSTRVVRTRGDGTTRRYGVRWEEISLMSAIGHQAECSDQCRHCHGRDQSVNRHQWALNARIATLNWCRVKQFLDHTPDLQQEPSASEGGYSQLGADEEEQLDRLLSYIVLAEDADQRRFSNPDLVPAPLSTPSTGGQVRQILKPPKRQPSPSEEISVDWLDESL